MSQGAMVPQTGLRGEGVLIAVVGPSGAGKDALIAAARSAYGPSRGVVFPRRVVTRSPDASAEPHFVASEREFAELVAAGAFVVTWRAHGHSYGVPVAVTDEIAAGRIAVVNVSRQVVGRLRQAFRRTHVVYVTAPAEVLTLRLRARGRESEAEIATRIARRDAFALPVPPVTVIDNAGALADAVEAFLAVIDAYIPTPSREVDSALD
jgi:ribose 1,5-bisphosphokinase